jgi:hypothetical protein
MAKLRIASKGMCEVKAESMEKSKYIETLRKGLHDRSFEKIVRVLDGAIGEVANNQGSVTIPWACVASLVGNTSNALGHGDVEYVWNKIIDIMGPDRFSRMTMGSLLMWRMAARAEEKDENWIAHQTEYEDRDSQTGERITRYEYFIGNN